MKLLSKLFLIAVFLFIVCSMASSVLAAVEINYQAKVTDDYGKIVPDGYYHMKFKIWGIGEDNQALWEEEYIGENKIKIEKGIFKVKLGQIDPLNFSFKEDGYYLSCIVGGREEEQDWNKGTSLVKKIKLADLKFKVDALNIEILENLDRILEPLAEDIELFTEVSPEVNSEVNPGINQTKKYSILDLFPKLWRTVSDLFVNFNQKVEKALASLGLVVRDGIANLKELTSNKITVENAYIKSAEIEKAWVKNLEISEKIQLYDQVTQQVYCVWIENGEWKKVEETCEDYLGSIDLFLGQENLTSDSSIITTTTTSSADNVSTTEENTATTTVEGNVPPAISDVIENAVNE